jgi:hypothetical protein
MAGAKVTFTGPAPKQHVPAAVLAACDIEAAAEVAYTALRDTRKPLDDRGTWRAYEDTMVLRPPRGTKGPDITVRRVFVHSTARAGAAKIARARKLDRARDDLDRLTRGLGSRHYPDEAAVRNRLAVIGKTRRVADYLTTTTGTDPGTGKPTLQWACDQAALKAESATDGWYALLTNLDPAEAGTASVLLRFKGQEASERRYGNYKGPLAVAPMFLQHSRGRQLGMGAGLRDLRWRGMACDDLPALGRATAGAGSCQGLADEGGGELLEVTAGGVGELAQGALPGEHCQPVHRGPDGVLDARAALPAEHTGVGQFVEDGAELIQGQGVLPGPAVGSAVGVLVGQGERGGEQPRLLAGELQVGPADRAQPAAGRGGIAVLAAHAADAGGHAGG